MKRTTSLIALLVFTFGLTNAPFAEELTLGLVQTKVKKGMSQGDVAMTMCMIALAHALARTRPGHG